MSDQTMKVALFRFHAVAMDHLNTSTLVYFRLPAASLATVDHLGFCPPARLHDALEGNPVLLGYAPCMAETIRAHPDDFVASLVAFPIFQGRYEIVYSGSGKRMLVEFTYSLSQIVEVRCEDAAASYHAQADDHFSSYVARLNRTGAGESLIHENQAAICCPLQCISQASTFLPKSPFSDRVHLLSREVGQNLIDRADCCGFRRMKAPSCRRDFAIPTA